MSAALFVAGVAVSGSDGGSSAGAVVKTAYNKELGKTILVAGNGMTLYMFTGDTGGTSICTGDCVPIWPALTSVGKPVAGPGVKAALLSTAKGVNGKPQAVYNRHPLYTFHGGGIAGAGDRQPGDVNGQNLFGAWFVLSPNGAPIKKQL